MRDKAYDTADNRRRIEVLFWIDNDDYESIATLGSLGVCLIGDRGRGYLDSGQHYNDLARASKGGLLGILNDDVDFMLQGWDTVLLEAAAKLPNGLGCLLVPDGNFPFVSRQWLDTLGFLVDSRELHNDTFIGDVARRAGCLIEVPQFVTGRRVDDATHAEAMALVRQLGTPHLFSSQEHTAWRVEAARKLERALHSNRA